MPIQRKRLEATLTRAWMRRGLLTWALLPLSWVFGLLTAIRRALFMRGWLSSTRLPVPVIVVGNIFIGGTGKTPLTIWLVQALQLAGYKPGVVSRGYGAAGEVPCVVTEDADAREVGDEPVLIAARANCPVMVGRSRVDAAKALLQAYPQVDVIVADDGLQHYALQRDIEIVLFDARGAGNGWLLPAGPLREPAQRQRDFTVVNAAQPVAGMPDDAIRMQLHGLWAERLVDCSQAVALAALPQTLAADGRMPRIVAAAGIGNPARFFATLHAAGIACEEMPLPDHYDFAGNPFAALAADVILITEKDAVKCRRIDALKNDPRLWVVPVTAQLDGALLEQLLEKLRGQSIA